MTLIYFKKFRNKKNFYISSDGSMSIEIDEDGYSRVNEDTLMKLNESFKGSFIKEGEPDFPSQAAHEQPATEAEIARMRVILSKSQDEQQILQKKIDSLESSNAELSKKNKELGDEKHKLLEENSILKDDKASSAKDSEKSSEAKQSGKTEQTGKAESKDSNAEKSSSKSSGNKK